MYTAVTIEPFKGTHLEAIAKILSDITTGSTITHYLKSSFLPDPDPANTKWKRLYNAFASFQNENGVANNIVNFIVKALDPALYTNEKEIFQETRDKLNRILAFSGLEFRDDGKMHVVPKAKNLSEAIERAQRLRAKLEARHAHPDIYQFAATEITSDNYFHTVLEAMKSVTAKIRDKTGIYADGSELIDLTMAGNTPRLLINSHKTNTEKGEQRGLCNLLKGMYGTFRNPVAHEPKIDWRLTEEDALDILSLISYIHRKLDNSRLS